MAQQHNSDLRATLAVSKEEATRGTTRVLTLPGGRQVTVNVPPGVNTGSEIRLEGQGPTTSTGQAGALILSIVVEPTKSQPYPYQQPAENNNPTELVPPPPPPPVNYDATPYQYPSSQPNSGPASNPGISKPISEPASGPVSGPHSGQPFNNGNPQRPHTFYESYGSTPQSQPYAGQTPYPEQTPAYPGQTPVYLGQGSSYPGQPTYNSVPPYIPPTQMAKPATRRSPGLLILLIIAALVLIIGGSSIIYATAVYLPEQNRIHTTETATSQTKTAVNQQTATVQSATAQAQATVNVNTTATASAATATATAFASNQANYNTTITQTPNLDDNMKSTGSVNWDSGTGCEFKSDGYHVSHDKKGYFRYCVAQNSNYSNFVFKAHTKLVSGDYAGIVFRGNLSGDAVSFYLLRIKPTGNYDIYYYPDKTGETAKKIIDGYSDAINQGTNQENDIAVDVKDSTISIYVNDKFVDTVTDTNLKSGLIGVAAGYQTTPAEAVFTKVQVWQQ